MSNVNDIINQINSLSGFNIPSSSVNVTSGSLSPAPYTTAASYVATATAPSGTISTAGISPGSVITSEQILRIINALNGVSSDTIIISGSLITSGLNEIDGTLALPFIEDGNYLFMSGGIVVGSTAIASSSFATSASYAITSSLPLLGIVTASATATTITFTKGDTTTFDVTIAQSGSVESASYATFAENAGTSSIAISSSFALTASYALNAGSPFSISTGSIVASVNTSPASIFLIQSASVPFLNIASNSDTTLYSDLFIVKSFTSQQPVLTVSESIVNIATHSIDPSGTTAAGNIYFTSGAMYIGLE
jgi:hypothetical protein